MTFTIDAEYLSARMQCSREDKQDCLPVVRQLTVLAYIGRERGLLAMEEEVRDRGRYPDAFLRKAVELTVEIDYHIQIHGEFPLLEKRSDCGDDAIHQQVRGFGLCIYPFGAVLFWDGVCADGRGDIPGAEKGDDDNAEAGADVI